jgi:hypothetical protein
VREFRTWSRLLNSKDTPPSVTGPSSRFLHGMFENDDLFCDVCGASWNECADVTQGWRTTPDNGNNSALRRSVVDNTPAPQPPVDLTSTLAASAKVHWDLTKTLMSHLKKVPPLNAAKFDNSPAATHHRCIGSAVDVANGLRLSYPKRQQELQGQIDAGRQFPAVYLPRDTLSMCSRMSAFSTAAYGPAYIDGFYSSIRCNGSLHLPGFRSFISPPEEIHRKAAKILLGIDDHKVVDVIRCTTYADEVTCAASCSIFVDHRDKNIVVAFRGTTSTGDLVTDTMSNPMLLSDVRGRGNPSFPTADRREAVSYVPEGFGKSIQHALLTVEEQLAYLEGSLCDYQTYLTGHSLGAIQANIFFLATATAAAEGDGRSASRSSNGSGRKVVGFAPAPCVSLGIAEAYHREDECTSVTADVLNFAFGHDAVPRLQVSSLRDKFQSQDHPGHQDKGGYPDHDDDDVKTLISGAESKYYLPGTTIWMDPARTTSSAPHGDSSAAAGPTVGDSPLRKVLVLPRQSADVPIIKKWNAIPSSMVSAEHHFLQWIQRDLMARIEHAH